MNDLTKLKALNMMCCDLCGRQGEKTQIEFDDNIFDVCETCRADLEGEDEEPEAKGANEHE